MFTAVSTQRATFSVLSLFWAEKVVYTQFSMFKQTSFSLSICLVCIQSVCMAIFEGNISCDLKGRHTKMQPRMFKLQCSWFLQYLRVVWNLFYSTAAVSIALHHPIPANNSTSYFLKSYYVCFGILCSYYKNNLQSVFPGAFILSTNLKVKKLAVGQSLYL